MICHDYLNDGDKDMYTLYLCTIDGKGDKFIPGGKDADSKRLKWIHDLLIKPWIVLDLNVYGVITPEGIPIFFIVDTELKV